MNPSKSKNRQAGDYIPNPPTEMAADEGTLLRLMIDRCPFPMAVLDGPEYCAVLVNPAYCRASGLDWSDLIGCPLGGPLAGGIQGKNRPLLDRVRATGAAVSLRAVPLRNAKERRTAHWDIEFQPLGTAGPRPVERILVSCTDATDRVAMQRQNEEERALRSRLLEHELRPVLDTVPAMIWMINNPPKRSVTVNKAARELLNLTCDGKSAAAAGDSTQDRISLFSKGRELPPWQHPLRRAARGQEVIGEDILVRYPDGSERQLHGNAVPLRDDAGMVKGAVAAFIDMTERRQAEARLADSELRHRTLFDNAPLGVTVIDPDDGQFLAFNDRAHYQFGYSREEFARLRVWDLDSRRGRARVLGQLATIAAEGRTRQFEMRYRRKDGQIIELLVSQHPVRLHGRSCIYAMHVDITELKRAQRELAEAKQVAEAANDAKTRFLAAASHDLRQPLQALNLYLGVLASKLSPKDTPVMRHVEHCVTSLSGLLTNMLDLSKLDAGAVRPVLAPFAVAELLDNVVSAHGPEARQKGLRLRAVTTRLVAITDRVLYERVIGNLVSNAVRYTAAGGVVLGCRQRDGRTWIEVWDSGIGIPEDRISESFEEFVRLSENDQPGDKGSGLGLAIVKRTAALLGLAIRVDSRPGRGSLFAVELPLGSMDPASEPAPVATDKKPRRIALVEDDADVRESLVYALHQAGHQVVAGSSPEQVSSLLNGHRPDLVIADFVLAGGHTGIGAIASLRALYGDSLAAIILTGDTDPASVSSIVARGIRVHHKPLRLEALLSTIADF